MSTETTIPDELSTAVDRFVTVIDSYSGVQVVEMSVSLEEVSFLCRAQDIARWQSVSSRFILAAPDDWKYHIGQRFVRTVRNGNAVVVNPWYISFRSDDIVALLEQAGGLLVKSSTGREANPAPGAVGFTPVKKAPAKPMTPKRRAQPIDGLPVHPVTITTKTPEPFVDDAGFTRTYQPVTVARHA